MPEWFTLVTTTGNVTRRDPPHLERQCSESPQCSELIKKHIVTSMMCFDGNIQCRQTYGVHSVKYSNIHYSNI